MDNVLANGEKLNEKNNLNEIKGAEKKVENRQEKQQAENMMLK